MPNTATAALTFGELLKQLRRRAGLTQGELAARIGYSVAQISRLEQNLRLPTVAAVAESFVPALDLGEELHLAHRLVEMAALARGERAPDRMRVTRTVHTAISEQAVEPVGYLPAALVRLVGRSQELDLVCQRLLAAPGRLLTLLGAPGVGKTQLSLAAAAKVSTLFRDGAWFVPLASVDDAELVAAAIARSLSVSLDSVKPPAQQLIEHLRRREVLLVLDNVEQVIDCAPLLVALLQACAGLRILVTSTAPLRLRAEQRCKVLPLPPAAAVELFIQRAQAVDPDFVVSPDTAGTITELCLHLDCLPLAIELLAARVDLLTPAAMLAQLQDQRLDLLTDGPRDLEAHHRTLRTAIQRSYTLLSAAEQAHFRRLGVFVGGCDNAAAEYMAFDLQRLHVLTHNGLVQRSGAGAEQRFGQLTTLRDFALEMLAVAGEEDAVRRQHAVYFSRLAQEASAHWHGPQQQQWLDRLETEHDNLRAAMRWLVDHDGGGAQQLGASLRDFWYSRGYFAEARGLLDQALQANLAPTAARGQALLAAARLAHAQDDNATGLQLIEACLPILQMCSDQAGYAEALRTGGWIAHSAGASSRARTMFTEALAISQASGTAALTADLHISIAQICALDGDEANFAAARRDFAEGLRIARQLNRRDSVAYALHGEATLEFMAGNYDRAIQLAEEALAIFRTLDFRRNAPLVMLLIGEAALLAGDLTMAHDQAQAALEKYTELTIPWGMAATQCLCGQTARAAGQLDAAATWLTTSLDAAWQLCDVKLMAMNLAALGAVALAQHAPEQAGWLLAAAYHVFDSQPRFLAPGYQALYAEMVDAVRAVLGDESFAATWRTGQALPLAQVVALGLQGSE